MTSSPAEPPVAYAPEPTAPPVRPGSTTDPRAATRITESRISYHRGETEGRARIIEVLPVSPGRWAVVTDRTPFHPIDTVWPDQPADHGTLTVDTEVLPVVDTQILTAERDTGQIRVGPEVTARRGDDGHVFAVAHLVEQDPSRWRGRTATLAVDVARRRSLSAAHTGCHLVAYAFNEATEELWSKEAPRDSRGSRNFDAAALIDSRHHLGGSVDRYRLGRSLRRKGFDHARLLAELDDYVERANEILAKWVASAAPVTVAGADLFTAQRTWRCETTPVATMPCGGTHVSHLGELATITIGTDYVEDEKELRLLAASVLR
ncbi:hypothetical protein [Verrucosispora sp. TAA-831]|uniref:hypothetical protein n=1 Tax=Verrucosispora sp. TAA-831 TaxID=3422227 RepID=UPI003D6ED905